MGLFNVKMRLRTSVLESVYLMCFIEYQLLFVWKITDTEDKTYVLSNGLRRKFANRNTIMQKK